jgi:hypothetical protein
MMYGVKVESRQLGPHRVWPWFFACLLSLTILGLSFLTISPSEIPPQSRLVKVGGELKTSIVRDDISNSAGAAVIPVFTSIYMKFIGDEHEYRYPWYYAQYHYVRNYTGYNVEVWVDKNDLDRTDGQPILIWALQEHNPHEPPEEQTVVTFEDTVAQLERNTDVLTRWSKWLGGAAIILLAGGIWTVRWNRRNFPDTA